MKWEKLIIILFIISLFGCNTIKLQSDETQKISQISFHLKGKEVTKATTGEKIKITAVTENISNEEPAVIYIYERTSENEYVEIETIHTSVKNNHIKAEWEVKYIFGEHNSENGNFGKNYKCPEYFFVAEINNCKSEISSPIQLYTNYYCKLIFNEKPLKNYPYFLILADGSRRSGKTNKKGMIIEKNIPIGDVKMF